MTSNQRLVQTLTAAYTYYGKELSEFAMHVWAEDLAGYDIASIEQAFVRHRRDTERGHWLPLSADILRQLNGDANEHALIAWGEVIAAAKNGGARFEGAAQEALESIGGMHRLRMCSESENGFLQREFMAAFKAFKVRDARERTSGNVLRIVGGEKP